MDSNSFGFYSSEEARGASVLEIKEDRLFEGKENTPVKDGLYDPRLGAVERRTKCPTCGEPESRCGGHLGHIELPRVCYQPLLFSQLFKVLQIKCLNCHNTRLEATETRWHACRLALLSTGQFRRVEALERPLSVLASLSKDDDKSEALTKLNASIAKAEAMARRKQESPKLITTQHARVARFEAERSFWIALKGTARCANCGAAKRNIKRLGHTRFCVLPPSEKSMRLDAELGLDTRFKSAQKDTMESDEDDDLSELGDQEPAKDELLLDAEEVRAQLAMLWQNCSSSMEAALGDIYNLVGNKSMNYLRFFLDVILVAPPRFRPAQTIGQVTAEHPQNIALQRILKIKQRIADIESSISTGELVATSKSSNNASDSSDSSSDSEGQEEDENKMINNKPAAAKSNNTKKKRIDLDAKLPPEERIRKQCLQLQDAINGYYDSGKALQRGAPPGIKQILERKEGMFRKFMMGKRVNYCARSVISPDPFLSSDAIGLPIKIAQGLSYPEPVTPHNVEALRLAVENGAHNWPGANYVELKPGRRILLDRQSKESRMAMAKQLLTPPGQKVGRHLIDRDYVLVNRQPTLHRPGIMAHRVKVLRAASLADQQTIRMHYANCNAYNADFDGDEMNLHLPQTEEAKAEAAVLMPSQLNISTPRNGEPLIAATQDFLTAVFLLTQRDIFFNKESFCALAVYAGDAMERIDIPKPAILRPQNLWTGKQLFSLLVKPNNDDLTIDYDQSLNSAIFQGDRLGHLKIKKPKKWPDISFQLAERNYSGSFELCPNDGYVHMRRSMLISGNVAKNTIGQGSKNGLVYTLYKDHGATAAATCMNRIAKLAARYLGYHCGFSIGIGDVTPSNELNQLKQREIFQGNADAAEQIKLFKNGQLPLKPGCDAGQSLEVELSGLLGKVREKCGKLAMKTLPRANAPRLMAESGAKGSALNVSQMTACLGQQAVDGKRVADGFYRRTLPHFPFDALEPAAKGFVQNSFFSGLSATEFFFHTMGGREGLVDTAVKSISWDTRIIVVDQGVCKHIEIGRWIDQRLASHKTKVKFYPNDHNLEVLNVSNVWISTTDMEGNISWGSVTALTRHDPGDVLYKIKTQSGREVTVTASKSLLVWDPKRRCLQEKEPAHVNTGDFVPVTEFLPTPRNYTTTIDLDSIFSKTEYIHGTQFHIALSLMKSAKHSHEKNARGWWKSNLGTKFSLPFSTMAQLQQFINKSECIKSGYIYQCATYGIDACIADKFELSYENGQFIGLFLAQGYAKETNVKITTIEDSVITFLRSWFTRWNINFVQEVSGSTILGYSTLLARLLHQFCGGASKNKFVPKEAFLASKEFVCGILSGFISGSGSIDEGGISASSASEILIEGISSLCTRLSIFCQTFVDSNDNYCITINTLWIDRFRQMVKLVHVPKQQKLMKLSTLTKIHMTKINDIVLDTIVSIDQVSPTLYPKMYDLTVPSTLNFGLANGLQVRDTAQTGYMARRLMKALEDLSVQYDGTVRNSESNIVQLVFGDDGLDPGKMEANDGPVDFDRLLFRLLSGDASPTEEDTNELTIDGFLPPQNTLAIKNSYDLDDTPAVRFQQEVKHFFEKKNIDPQTAATFKKLASWKYMRTLVEAGEAVGAVGAQCISEPGTQMTLKTFHFAGVASMNVTLGVPRLTEIINASKSISTPIITAALDNAYDAGVARVVKARLEKTTLGEVCKEMKQVFDLKNGACLEVVLDLHLINDLDLNVNLASARSAVINAKTQAKCPPILRVLNAEHLQIRGGAGNLDTFRVMLPSCDSIKSTTTNAWKPGNYYSTAHSSKIKLDHGDDPTIFALHALKQALPNVVVTGIPSVNRVVINSDEKETNKYHLLVEGYGLEQVMGTEGVDGRNTTTNHVNELESVLGIEAARATISSEISYIMRAYGISIDRRHLALLSDVMTFKGLVLGITRFGVSKMRESVLMLASFERTTDHLFDAAVHGRNDKIVGVSECIIMGIPIPLGTGSFKLLQDNHASGTAPLPPESINKKKILSPFHKKRSLIMNHYR